MKRLVWVLAVIVGCSSNRTGDNQTGPTRVDVGLQSRESNSTCVAPARPSSTLGSYAFQWVTMPTGIDTPIFQAQAPGNDSRFYILERPGRVKTYVTGDAAVTTAVDFSADVDTTGEGGALGIAFHPNFSTHRYAYIYYTGPEVAPGINPDVELISRVRRYTVSVDGTTFSSPLEILGPTSTSDQRLRHELTNHKGGWIGFSPLDGYLYIAIGDGGIGAGSVPISGSFSHPSQDPNSLFGKILRIDVDGGSPYGIPSGNPYASGGGAPEVYALGFRNPWRASFDRLTGELWVGDVGEGDREEVNRVELGGNYGWPFMEGNLDRCAGCSAGQTSLRPVLDFDHADGWVAITGGYVYRGSAIPALQGRYIFGDFIRSDIMTISYDGDGEPFGEALITGSGGAPTFSEDNAGNLWAIQTWGGFYRLAETAAPPASTFPELLSETGCFDASDVSQVSAGVVPYDIRSPLWSDGASKERYFAIPDGETLTVRGDGQWEFPIGSVLIKTFRIGSTPVETRLLVRHADGDWGGYSYEWNAGGTDADLLPSGKTKTVSGVQWRYPSRAQCMSCHTSPTGNPSFERVLGPETGQMNRDFIYPGNLISNQIDTLQGVGYFASDPGDPATLATFAVPSSSTESLQDRARAYLYANCAHCHQPGGPGRGPMDFRMATSLATAGYCDEAPTLGNLGIAGALLLDPGSPSTSIIPQRMRASNSHRMPPLGVSVSDTSSITMIENWIASLSVCP